MSGKLLFILLIAGVAFAGSTDLGHRDGATVPTPQPMNPEAGVNNPYDYGTLANGLACYEENGWYTANDFEFDYSGGFDEYTIWIVYYGTVSAFMSIDSMFYDGDASGPGSLLEIVPGSFVLTDTEDDNWGFTLYQCDVEMDNSFFHSASCYWMTFNPISEPLGSYCYWLHSDHDWTWGAEAYFSEDGGYSWNSSTTHWGSAYEGFWVIDPYCNIAVIEEATWGQIKAEF